MPPAQGPNSVRSSAIAERASATRAALMAAARTLFVEKGYFATGTEEIVAAAGVGTRGALYHHFADKRALFLAVLEGVEEQLVVTAASAVREGNVLDQLRDGLMGFLEAALTPEVQRILLIDGPAVLGWQEWRALEERYGLGALRAVLDQAVAEGLLPVVPVEAIAHMLLAAIDEAALYIANAQDSDAAKVLAVQALDRLLNGLIPSSRASERLE